jgi:rhodanese-related sulfurtransferase
MSLKSKYEGAITMSVSTMHPRTFDEQVRNNGGAPLIDVRTPAEYESLHAEGARNLPLDKLSADAACEIAGTRDGKIYIICHSGMRAAKACEQLKAAGIDNVVCIEGGTQAWEQAGLPVVRGTRKVLPILRQVHICAGSLVLGGVVIATVTGNPWWTLLSGFVGAGLIFAGVTGTCGMAMLLSKMPWNQGGAKCQMSNAE